MTNILKSTNNSFENSFYIFGIHPVEELLNKIKEEKEKANKIEKIYFNFNFQNSLPPKIKYLITIARQNKIPFSFVDERRLNEYSQNKIHQGVVALLQRNNFTDFKSFLTEIKKDADKKHCLLILDDIQDTHNMGAIIRSAAALNISAILLEKFKNAPLSGIVYKTSAGQIENINLIQVHNLNESLKKLKENGFWIYGLSLKGSDFLQSEDLKENVCFVIGNEEKGISKLVEKSCDKLLKIKINPKVESLNASVSAGLCMYEWMKQNML